MYRLLVDETLLAAWDNLPTDASEQLTLALADVCTDPIAHTEPYGIDDGIHRQLIRPLIFAVLAVNQDRHTVRIYHLEQRTR